MEHGVWSTEVAVDVLPKVNRRPVQPLLGVEASAVGAALMWLVEGQRRRNTSTPSYAAPARP